MSPALATLNALAADASDGVIDLSAVDRDTAVIQYWLNGAASHFETYDPKPDAPLGIRSPFHPIATNVPGTFICESLPLHAKTGCTT